MHRARGSGKCREAASRVRRRPADASVPCRSQAAQKCGPTVRRAKQFHYGTHLRCATGKTTRNIPLTADQGRQGAHAPANRRVLAGLGNPLITVRSPIRRPTASKKNAVPVLWPPGNLLTKRRPAGVLAKVIKNRLALRRRTQRPQPVGRVGQQRADCGEKCENGKNRFCAQSGECARFLNSREAVRALACLGSP